MGKIINFDSMKSNYKKEKEVVEPYIPQKKDIELLKAVSEVFKDEDTRKPLYLWDGEDYQAFFTLAISFAKDANVNEWDMFALLMSKIQGVLITEEVNGNIRVSKAKMYEDEN